MSSNQIGIDVKFISKNNNHHSGADNEAIAEQEGTQNGVPTVKIGGEDVPVPLYSAETDGPEKTKITFYDFAKIKNSGFWFTQLKKLGIDIFNIWSDFNKKKPRFFSSEVGNDLSELGFRTYFLLTPTNLCLLTREGKGELEVQLNVPNVLVQEINIPEGSDKAVVFFKRSKFQRIRHFSGLLFTWF